MVEGAGADEDEDGDGDGDGDGLLPVGVTPTSAQWVSPQSSDASNGPGYIQAPELG